MGDLMLWTQHKLEMWSDFMRPLLFWNRPTWTIDQIPDMTGQVSLSNQSRRSDADALFRSCL